MHQEPRKLLRRNKKAFFIIFKGLSVASNCLRPECLPLILLAISLLIPYISDIFSTILCHVFFLASASAMMSSWCYFFLSHGQVLQFLWPNSTTHCVKSVGEIRSTSPIQSECRKMRTRIIPSTGTFYALFWQSLIILRKIQCFQHEFDVSQQLNM